MKPCCEETRRQTIAECRMMLDAETIVKAAEVKRVTAQAIFDELEELQNLPSDFTDTFDKIRYDYLRIKKKFLGRDTDAVSSDLPKTSKSNNNASRPDIYDEANEDSFKKLDVFSDALKKHFGKKGDRQ